MRETTASHLAPRRWTGLQAVRLRAACRISCPSRLNPPSARHCEGVFNSRQRAAISTDGPNIPDVQLLPLWDAGDDFNRRQRDARPSYSSYRTLGDFAEIRRAVF